MTEERKVVRPRMLIDVESARVAATKRLRDEARVPADATLDDLDRGLAAANRLYRLLADTSAPETEREAAAERVIAHARKRVDHPDADEARPRALALEVGAGVALEALGDDEAAPWWREAAERWLEAAGDEGSRAKDCLLRASDAFVGAKAFDRAAGCYARALTIGEDSYRESRRVHPSLGAHRLKLVVLLLAAGKEAEARSINNALCEELRLAFSRKVPREGFEEAHDRARALAEASALAGDMGGERAARLGAVDLAVAIAKREAKRGGADTSSEDALRWADEALGDALRTGDDAVFMDAYRRGAKALLDGALAGIEGNPADAARASCVRLLFDAGRRFQLMGEGATARECHERAYELSPKFSPGDRRPADEMAMCLYLLKGPPPEPETAEVHLKNASALVKALIQAAGVHEDHPSARLRQLALREAFYRRMGNIRKRDEVLSIMGVAAADGAVAELEKAAAQYNAASYAGARESLDQAVAYLERIPAERDLLHQTLLARSLVYYLDPQGPPPETAAERAAREARTFSPAALGFEWRPLERALLQMDPPAEFGRVEEILQFVKGRSPKAR